MSAIRVYANNAATSFPKPAAVAIAVQGALSRPPAGTGRGGASHDELWPTREAAQELFSVREARQVILLGSATQGLNLAILGNVESGQRVAASVWSHNSVTRPLAHLARSAAVSVDWFDPLESSGQGLAELGRSLSQGAKLVLLSPVCNVTGAAMPYEAVAEMVAKSGATLVLDAAQAAGVLPLDYGSLPGRVYLAASGHKALLGPEGTGLLVVPDEKGRPVLFGGTGAHSASPLQPEGLPQRYEAGTPNLPGLAGLGAGMRFVLERGLAELSEVRQARVLQARQRLRSVSGLTLLSVGAEDARSGTVAVTASGWLAEDFSAALATVFGVETRGGLHCAPESHRRLGTFPDGCVRISFGPFSSPSDVTLVCDAVAALVEQPREQVSPTEPAMPATTAHPYDCLMNKASEIGRV